MADHKESRDPHWGKVLLASVVILTAMFTIVEALFASVNGNMSQSWFYFGVTVAIVIGAGLPTIWVLESEYNAE